MNGRMKKPEWIMLAVIAAVCLLAIIVMHRPRTDVTVQVIHDGKTVLEFTPEQDALYHVEGNCGGLDIEVKNGRWHVIHEQCPNHICAKTGWASAENLAVITCMPNDIVIRISEYNE